jgi:hypothetical protein
LININKKDAKLKYIVFIKKLRAGQFKTGFIMKNFSVTCYRPTSVFIHASGLLFQDVTCCAQVRAVSLLYLPSFKKIVDKTPAVCYQSNYSYDFSRKRGVL